MLWRTGYQTIVRNDVVIPESRIWDLTGEVVNVAGPIAFALGFSARSFQQREVWRRLFEAELPIPFWTGVISEDNLAESTELLQAMTPKSRWSSTVVVLDPQRAWRNLIEPEDEERCFALISRGNTADVVMIGPPTEEAWERFLAQAARR